MWLTLQYHILTAKQLVSNILIGWWFVIISKNQDIHDERISICNSCESNKNGKCVECGCPLKAKLRVTKETCILDKWH